MKVTRAKRKSIRARRPKGYRMTDELQTKIEVQEVQTLITKGDPNQGLLEIRADNGSAGRLEIYLQHPVLADVVEKMAIGNFSRDQFDKVYEPCLMAHPNEKAQAAGKVVSRPAIYQATKNFQAAPDFDFSQPPRGVLISNPDALRKGFSLFVELKTPVPHDTLRKWGKLLMDGCADIIAASRPFTMQWVMTESTPAKL